MRLVLIVTAFVGIALPFASAHDDKPSEKVTLRNLDRAPDKYLGRRVNVEGMLTKEPSIATGPITLTVGFDKNSKPLNITFSAPASLAEQLKGEIKSFPISIRIIGPVMAPESSNGAYVVDVEEVILLAGDGTLGTVFKPIAAAAKMPETAAAPSTEPSKEAESEELPMNVLMGGAAALAVACLGCGIFLLRRRAAARAAEAMPQRSVADRLNRRIK